MSQTIDLEIWVPDTTRTGKISYNQAIEDLADALAATLAVDASSYVTPYTIPYGALDTDPKSALRFVKLKVTGALAAGWTAYVPAREHLFVIENATTGGHAVTVMVLGQTGVAVSSGSKILAYCNGTDVEQIGGAGGSGTVTSITAGVGLSGGTITTSGTIDLTSPVTVAHGGTGTTSLTAHGVVVGAGSSAVTVTSAGTSGNVLTSNGAAADPTFQAAPVVSVNAKTGTVTLALASSDFANQGTTTTVLHGNASGNPSFAAVDLANDVTGNLGVSHLNGGTSASSSTFWRGDGSWATPAGSGTVTSVATGTGLTGGTITGTGTISLAAIANHDLLANTSGGSAAPVATTLTALIDDALGNTQGDILYRGASGWAVLAPGSSGNVLQSGGAGADPSWVAAGGTGTVTSVGISSTDLSISGSPVTGSGSITLNVNSAAITNAKLASMVTHTIKGNATGSTAAPTDMTGTTTTALLDAVVGDSGSGGTKGLVPAPASGDAAAGKFLKADGTWATVSGAAGGTVTSVATGTGLTGGPVTSTGTIALASIANHDLLANTSGGSAAPIATTLTALIDDALGSTQGNILYRNASAWVVLAPGTSGQRLKTQGGSANPVWDDEPFDIACYYGTSVLTSLNIGLRFTATRAINFAANFGSIVGGVSHATASVAATASTVFNVDKAASGSENTWSTIGTITYGVAGVTASFATTGGATQSLAAGDSLRIIAPSTPDATLAGVSITLAGSR